MEIRRYESPSLRKAVSVKNEVLISIAGAVSSLTILGDGEDDDWGEGELGVITGMETLGGVCRLT